MMFWKPWNGFFVCSLAIGLGWWSIGDVFRRGRVRKRSGWVQEETKRKTLGLKGVATIEVIIASQH
jgi:hypothetical protein